MKSFLNRFKPFPPKSLQQTKRTWACDLKHSTILAAVIWVSSFPIHFEIEFHFCSVSDFKLLDGNKFKSYFPSWSRKRREANAILEDEYIVPESRLFNITKTGFGTITYDWRDVINDYLRSVSNKIDPWI